MSAQMMPVLDNDSEYESNNIGNDRRQRLIPGLVLTVLIITLFSFIGIKLADPSTLPVRHVSISGEFKYLSPISLQKRVSEVVTGGFFNVNVETIQKVLMEEPWAKEVSVNRTWPDRITVTIREQIAIARWGDSGLMSSDAQIFYPDPATFPDNQPIVYGPDSSVRQIMEYLLQIQKVLPKELTVNELILSERRSWDLKLNNGAIMRLGKENVVGRIEKFFNYYTHRKISNFEQIEYVDMRYTNGFVIRLNSSVKPDLKSRQENYGKEI
ncbi:MAG: cell division protein FtsQ [Gammaproteobacteria bacterium]|jgi:cell division protein FtsQ